MGLNSDLSENVSLRFGRVRGNWREIITRYQKPDLKRSIYQIFTSVLPYVALLGLMVFSLRLSYWLTFLLAVPTAGFMVRTFIIFHDCGHGSFFKSNEANNVWGMITGVLTLTPYYHWRRDHAIHHASAGNLDKRGIGDVMTLTVIEFQKLPWWKKLGYRFIRSPWIMFTVGSLFVFVVTHRFYHRNAGKREKNSVVITNLTLLGILIALSLTIGFINVILVLLPVLMIGTGTGVWLFYVQHNFEGTYWERRENWNFVDAAMKGSSFYKLPKLLQWFTGNIGFHHIHHLSPRIPNYFLERCYKEHSYFQSVRPLTLLLSLKSLRFRLWDEESRKLVGFGYLKKLRVQRVSN